MQVMWERINGRVMGSIVPPLEQVPLAILPVMTILGDRKRTLPLQDTLGHLDEPTVHQGHTIAVVHDFLQVRITERPPDDLHVAYDQAGAQQLLDMAQVGLDHSSVASRSVAICSR